MSTLQEFLGVGVENGPYRLVLPQFRGSAAIEAEGTDPSLIYRGPVFAERDTRAAFYIRTLLQDVVEPSQITIEPADQGHRSIDGPAFLFGSRSNVITLESLRHQRWPLVDFEFGKEWKILCAGKTFATADPSTIDRASYEAATDYGVVARLTSGANALFLIAGLGGRATEACAYYLLNNWLGLAQSFDDRAFALVLEFPPPFDQENVRRVAEATDPNFVPFRTF